MAASKPTEEQEKLFGEFKELFTETFSDSAVAVKVLYEAFGFKDIPESGSGVILKFNSPEDALKAIKRLRKSVNYHLRVSTRHIRRFIRHGQQGLRESIPMVQAKVKDGEIFVLTQAGVEHFAKNNDIFAEGLAEATATGNPTYLIWLILVLYNGTDFMSYGLVQAEPELNERKPLCEEIMDVIPNKQAAKSIVDELKDAQKELGGTGTPDHKQMLELLTAPWCRTCWRDKPTKVCGKCKCARYCSRECQKQGWAEHKHSCAFIRILAERAASAVYD
jgi:hypothetical protein